CGEQFNVDPLLVHSEFLQCLAHVHHHRFRATDKIFNVLAVLHEPACELRGLLHRNKTIEQHVLVLPESEDVVDPETVTVLCLQFLQITTEDDPIAVGIAIEQGELAVWFGSQHRPDDAEDGRNTASTGKAHIVLAVLSVEQSVKITHGCHHLQGHAWPQGFHQHGG